MPPAFTGSSRPRAWERRSTAFSARCAIRAANCCRAKAMPRTVPATYEFPREFRKVRGSMVQFLVDLCRPSQLTTAPFLRGFYFSGVRPITVDEFVPAAAPVEQAAAGSADATGIFRRGERAPAPAQARAARRVAAGAAVALPQPSVSRRHSAGSRGAGRQRFQHEDQFCATRDARLRGRPVPDSRRRASSRRGCETGTWNRALSKRRGVSLQRIQRAWTCLRWTRCRGSTRCGRRSRSWELMSARALR